MYLWDIRGLAYRLKQGTLSTFETTLYCILSPLLSISNGLFFSCLLFSHQIVEYSFQGWLGAQHPYIQYYNVWSIGLSVLTVIISFTGIYLCYTANKSGDGKDFWKRLACLSFPINFHIIIYTFATLSISAIILYFLLQEEFFVLKYKIWPSSTPPKSIPQPGYIGAIFALPVAICKLPGASIKIEPFLIEARAMIMMGYPVLSLLPPLLSLSHYMIVRRLIKRVARQKPAQLTNQKS